MIEEVRLRNFEGFEEARVKFTEGLNLVTGRNSTGKTSLLDSIVFGLFGSVPGIENRLLVSHRPNVRESEVYIRFRSPRVGARVEVYRLVELRHGKAQTSRARLVVDGREEHVESLEELRKRVSSLLGVGYRSFNWIVYSRQGRITDILEPDRREMDTVLGISLLQELSEQIEQARRRISRMDGVDVETEYRNLLMNLIPMNEERLREIERDLEMDVREITELEREIQSAESPVATVLYQKVRELERSREALESTLRTKRDLLSRHGLKDVESAIREKADLDEELRRIQTKMQEIEDALGSLQSEHASVVGKLRSLREHLEKHRALLVEGRARCPTCGQRINQLILYQLIEEEEEEVRGLESKQRELTEKISELRARQEEQRELEKRVRGRIERLDALVDTLRELEERQRSTERLVTALEAETIGLVRSLGIELDVRSPRIYDELRSKIPPADAVRAKRDRLRELRDRYANKMRLKEEVSRRLDEWRRRVEELERRLTAVGIADRLRERLGRVIEGRRESILRSLGARALEIFNSMTDQRLYDSIAIDPETYSVSVRPTGLAGYIPASRIGGGHQTMLSLALRLSILDFIGFRHLIILDEPTYGVDQENLQQLLEYLSQLRRYVRQAIVVTHHGHGLEEADNVVTVYREGAVSKVRQGG